MIRTLTVLVILALAASVIYLWFFKKPEQIVHESTTIIVAETPIKRLSAFVDTNLDKIFCPLDPGQTLMPTQELRQVQQTLLDLRSKATSDSERRLYATGISLCKHMLDAISLRESHNCRISDMRKKGFDSQLAGPRNKAAEEKRKKDFFESGVIRSWEAQAAKSREKIQKEYDQMRLLER
jgi:hypothetical protein